MDLDPLPRCHGCRRRRPSPRHYETYRMFMDMFEGKIEGAVLTSPRLFLHAPRAPTGRHAVCAIACVFVCRVPGGGAEYVSGEGITSLQLYQMIRKEQDACDGRDRWGEAAVFATLVLASSSYESFLAVMKQEADEAVEEGLLPPADAVSGK